MGSRFCDPLVSKGWLAGERLCQICCRHLAVALVKDDGSSQFRQQLQSLLGGSREALQHGFEVLLRQRLSLASQ